MGQVLDAVHALDGVVQVHEGGAVAGRAADVGSEDRVAARQEELEDTCKVGTVLAFRAAVRVDNDRRRRAGGARSFVEPRRNLPAIESGIVDQLWLDELAERDASAAGVSELARLVGASRPKVNAALGMLETAGAIKRTMDRLFCDPVKLAELARRDDAW